MTDPRILTVDQDQDGQRLNRWLAKVAPDLPMTLIYKLLRKGQIRVDGKRSKADYRLKKGEIVRMPPYRGEAFTPKKLGDNDIKWIKDLIIYDDGEILAINKPEGIACQGGTGQKRHIDYYLPALIGKAGEAKLVHRLDKDTSGVLLLARGAKMAAQLGKLFQSKDVEKIYWALCAPTPSVPEGLIEARLSKGKKGSDLEKMFVSTNRMESQYAATEFIVLDSANAVASFVAFRPLTGRTHQIRVHANHIGAPLLGDLKYGGDMSQFSDGPIQAMPHLHARTISLIHPTTKKPLVIKAPLSQYKESVWQYFGMYDTATQTSADQPFEA